MHEVADLFFSEVVELAPGHRWVSSDHFSVDDMLIDACASMKSFKAKGSDRGPDPGNPWSDFKGEKRSNATHASTTDPEAKLLRTGAGKESRLCFAAHVTMGSAAARPHNRRSARSARRDPRQNRHGLCVLFDVRPAVGEPESSVAVEQAAELHNRGLRPKTKGADKGSHTREFIEGMREVGIRPHPALKAGQYVVATWNLLRMAKIMTRAPPGGWRGHDARRARGVPARRDNAREARGTRRERRGKHPASLRK